MLRRTADGGEWPLDLSPPCFVVRPVTPFASARASDGATGDMADGGPQVWAYPDVHLSVVAIAGRTPEGAADAADRPPSNRACADAIQGLLIGERAASVSEREPYSRVCRPGALDEKEYWLLAHPR